LAALAVGMAGARAAGPITIDDAVLSVASEQPPLVLSGWIRLEGVFLGELEDVATPVVTRSLGTVAFAVELVVGESGEAGGHVRTDDALTFHMSGEEDPAMPGGLAGAANRGPAVHGTVDEDGISLSSEQFEWTMSASDTLVDKRRIPARTASRRFRLVGTATDDGRYAGEYRETVSGIMPEAVTVVGTFDIGPSVYELARSATPGEPTVTPRPTRTSTVTPGGPTSTPSATSTGTSAAPGPTVTSSATVPTSKPPPVWLPSLRKRS